MIACSGLGIVQENAKVWVVAQGQPDAGADQAGPEHHHVHQALLREVRAQLSRAAQVDVADVLP